jgi:GTP cyclohydrolase II
MNLERILAYEVDDFIIDDDFRKILKSPDNDRVLENLILNFPEKEREMKCAAEILEALHVNNFTQSTERKDKFWNELKREFL